MAIQERRTEREVGTPPARPVPYPRGAGAVLKRLVLGPALPTANLQHERLGKPTALAVFASDNLSSSAYATEEILKVAVPAVGVAAFGLLMPVTFGILAVLAILLFSYRQTIHAYPSAGGAYIVTRDNFGILTAQVAGVALLTDYVLTVAVSVSAGVAAIVSAVPALFGSRVILAVLCIWFITWGNLRGVRESGRMFALPTYFFIVMMLTLIGVGIARSFGGELPALEVPTHVASTTGTVGIFLALHAFASGGAAVTGVEAISNGVPAFRPPEWRNARTTLMWMGSLLGIMFLGLSFLAFRLHAVPTESQTLISQIAHVVFGGDALGTTLYFMVQIGTMLILILAANTSFADFPRLAKFHAEDAFMPRQLATRGHRLVFSNGIIGLAIASTVLVVAFGADVHRLIPLYAIGVFLSFTLSQAGMAKRHLRIREAGWRRGLLINGLGALTTAVVCLVIGATKFTHGAWAIVVFVPVGVWTLVHLNRRYEEEAEQLDVGNERFDAGIPRRPIALVIVEDLDRKTLHALQYAKTIRASEIRALQVDDGSGRSSQVDAAWREARLDVPLRSIRHDGDAASSIAGYAAAIAADDADVTVILPGPAHTRWLERVRRGRAGARLARALAPYPTIGVTLVRDHAGPGHPVATSADGGTVVHLMPRDGHRVIVLVDHPDRGAMRAVRYALSLPAQEIRAVHAAVDPDEQQALIERWLELAVPIELDLVECWDRDVARTLERYTVEHMSPRGEVTVVLPRRDYASLRQRLLHDRTSRRITRALGRYEHVDIAVVPYFFPRPRHRSRRTAAATADRSR